MAQTEDTELRDIVIEALEKNGSLAKIRALLRANIFLAFEDECENMRHNMSLDSILKVPEGIFALSLVHEFLEFCNLKNTLFVYKSESRQGKDYKYDGNKSLFDKLNLNKRENTKEPVLITLIKTAMKVNFHNQDDSSILKKLQDCGDNSYKDDHNSSYIVHEDSQSSASSTSQSDNSMDEKNKLHLRLQLDNSDTDSSTDSSRGKSASEYIPSEHIVPTQNSNSPRATKVESSPQRQDLCLPNYFTKVAANNSSESTSYVDLKPFTSIDEKMLNTSGLPIILMNDQNDQPVKERKENSKSDSIKSATLSSISSISLKSDNQKVVLPPQPNKEPSQESTKSDGETAEYSFDFSTSQGTKYKDDNDKPTSLNSPRAAEINKSSPIVSPHENSHSSISISDVADLISDRSSSFDKRNSNEKSPDKSLVLRNNFKNKSPHISSKLNSDDSGDFTESPVPSLSNLSLDIHSD